MYIGRLLMRPLMSCYSLGVQSQVTFQSPIEDTTVTSLNLSINDLTKSSRTFRLLLGMN
jgi:hypothetical protein